MRTKKPQKGELVLIKDKKNVYGKLAIVQRVMWNPPYHDGRRIAYKCLVSPTRDPLRMEEEWIYLDEIIDQGGEYEDRHRAKA